MRFEPLVDTDRDSWDAFQPTSLILGEDACVFNKIRHRPGILRDGNGT
ncbi:hypothetical protein N8494_01080 [bacterium]|nr:hypothetical protein [bacterium]MDA7511559.1 hypothetical protein [Verrucomicrobiota bacterium]MDA7866707.1 hypothetical protein [Verrucomicrobiota bacterium]